MGRQPVSFHQELKEFTESTHKEIEQKLDIKNRLKELATYTILLRKMLGFYLALESSLASFDTGEFHFVKRSPLIQQDLKKINADPTPLKPAELPACLNMAEATGIMYVLEGSMLGGTVIAQHLQENLGLTPESGAAFYFGKGPQTMPNWKNFLIHLEMVAQDSYKQEAIKQSALRTFQLLQKHLV